MVDGIRMQAGAIWARWLEVLAGLLFAGREIWRAQRPFVVSHEDGRFVVRKSEPPSGLLARLTGKHDAQSSPPASLVAEVAAGSRAPDDLALALRSGLVIHELAAEKTVMRQISVPAQAREFLPGIVRNQVERLSPWHAEQTVYGFADAVSQDDAAALDVRVFVTSRAAIASARDELDAIGLAPDQIVARMDGGAHAVPAVLWSRFANVPRETGRADASADRRCNRRLCADQHCFEHVGVLVGRLHSRRERGARGPVTDIATPAARLAHPAGRGIAARGRTRMGLEGERGVNSDHVRSPVAGAARCRASD